MEVKPGNIAYSKAGRDKDNYFVIMSLDGEYVKICDGKKRKVDKPKRKKLKHLKLGAGHSAFIEKKLQAGERVTNTEIRRELSEYNKSGYSEREC